MPARNVDKVDIAESFYHVYARGGSKQKVFLDASDYKFFLGLFERYLSAKQFRSKTGVIYPSYRGKIELHAYCLMRNHFHLVIYQVQQESMKRLMQSMMTSYSKYFNLKYKRSGPVFESRYKAARIDTDDYLLHISRYVHLNPYRWQNYRYSSLKFYLRHQPPEWLQPERILQLFGSPQLYSAFVKDYEDSKRVLDEIKHMLADH